MLRIKPQKGKVYLALNGIPIVYPTPIYQLLEEENIDSFRIIKRIIPKDTVLDFYDHYEGKIYKARLSAPIPSIVLMEGATIWMSDTPYEFAGMINGITAAKGNVLVGGLGLGIFPYYITKFKKVKHIDIVEQNPEVVELVYSKVKSKKMNIIIDDFWHYIENTVEKYDFIYLDIWGDQIRPLKEVDKVVEATSKCLNTGGQLRYWMQELAERIKSKLPTEPQESSGAGAYEPCLMCGKTVRHDYASLCMDCADILGVSEIYIKREEVEV